MATNPLRALSEQGQSVWLDYIERSLFDGELARMITEDGLAGMTSNPAIFHKAITGSDEYDGILETCVREQPGVDSRELFYCLAIEDIRAAADRLRDTYDASNKRDGYISLEVSPDLAYDTDGTIEEAHRLFERVDRPNVMIKVPGTAAGLPAIRRLIADGLNINVTLLFSLERYQAVVDAYLAGLQDRLDRNEPVAHIASVASFFVSRVDTLADQRLAELVERNPEQRAAAEALNGRIAVANAKLAYQHYKSVFEGARFQTLRDAGAQVQRLLWASTGTKNPAYSDVLYVEELIGPDTVTTLPPATYDLFKDHGRVRSTLEENLPQAEADLQQLEALGIQLADVTHQLEEEGVEAFAKPFNALLTAIEEKAVQLRDTAGART